MCTCLQCQVRLTTCKLLLRSRMRSYHSHFCSWCISSNQVGPHSDWLGSFRTNTFILLLLQESMVQRVADKHDQWRRYMTVLVVKQWMKKSINILTTVIRPRIWFEVAKLKDCFCHHVKWMLAILYQLSTLSALDWNRVPHLPHALLQDKDTYCVPEGNQWIPNTLRQIQRSGDYKAVLSCHQLND